MIAMSPAAKIRSWPTTRRSGPVRIRPARPVGRPCLAGQAPPLELGHKVIAQDDGVAPGVQAQGVLGRPWHAEESRADARRQDQVVVAEYRSVGEQPLPRVRVKTGHLTLAES